MNRLLSTLALPSLRRTAGAAAMCLGLFFSGGLQAQAPSAAPAATLSPLFKDADLPLGLKLIAEHRCTECHTRRVGGNGSAIYRPTGKINTPGLLRGMVDYCSTELNMGLFPEEVTAIAAVLDRDHYRFAQKK